jgi:exosortase
MTKTTIPPGSRRPLQALLFVVVSSAAVAWAYANTLEALTERWGNDPQYSHGYLVPLFAVGLLWSRRSTLDWSRLSPSLWGLLPVLVGVALRFVSARYSIDYLDGISLLPTLAGFALLVGGSAALRWSWLAIAFLAFMIPLPYRVEIAMQGPLQRFGTLASTYIMQTVGLPAFAEGNIITLGDVRIGVVEACSGLRMLMIFFALTTAVVLVQPGPLWRQVAIVLSAFPIAIVANISRITVTGVLHSLHWSHFADLVFHDLAGWLMMPLALLLLWAETRFLDRLVVIEEELPVALDESAAIVRSTRDHLMKPPALMN